MFKKSISLYFNIISFWIFPTIASIVFDCVFHWSFLFLFHFWSINYYVLCKQTNMKIKIQINKFWNLRKKTKVKKMDHQMKLWFGSNWDIDAMRVHRLKSNAGAIKHIWIWIAKEQTHVFVWDDIFFLYFGKRKKKDLYLLYFNFGYVIWF